MWLWVRAGVRVRVAVLVVSVSAFNSIATMQYRRRAIGMTTRGWLLVVMVMVVVPVMVLGVTEFVVVFVMAMAIVVVPVITVIVRHVMRVVARMAGRRSRVQARTGPALVLALGRSRRMRVIGRMLFQRCEGSLEFHWDSNRISDDIGRHGSRVKRTGTARRCRVERERLGMLDWLPKGVGGWSDVEVLGAQ